MRAQNQSGGGIVGNSNVPVGGNPNNQMSGVVGPQTRLTNSIGPSGVVGSQHGKPDAAAMWVHPNNNRNNAVSTWGDDGHNVSVGGAVSGNNWVDDKSNTGLSQIGANSNSWNDSPAGGAGGWGKPNKLPSTNPSGSGWSNANATPGNVDAGDLSSDWPHGGGIVGKTQQQQQQQKLSGINVGVLNTDMVKQSKQYRILVENGFKKMTWKGHC